MKDLENEDPVVVKDKIILLYEQNINLTQRILALEQKIEEDS